MAEPTNISRAQKLLEEMNAKYGTTPSAPPVQQTAPPVVQPTVQQPPQRGLVNDATSIIKGRQQQIDKASGYACGGKVKAHADGGKVKTIKGPGTSTSDSIPAKVKETGEQILVSNGERILSKKQDKLLDKIAKMLGYETTDDLLASGTGRPVGPTMKDGKKAAALGWNNDVEDEYTKAMQNNVISNLGGRDYDPATVGQPEGSNNPNGAAWKTLKDAFLYNSDVAAQQSAPKQAAPSAVTNPLVSGANYGNEGRSVPAPISKSVTSTLITGRNNKGAITADSAQAAYGNDMQRSGGVFGTYDGNGVNDILARENAAREGMINSMINSNGPAGAGFAALPDNATLPGGGLVSDWNNTVGMSAGDKAKYMLARQGVDNGRYATDVQGQRAAGHDQVLMRSQDMMAQSEAAKLAGSPYDKARAAEADQLTALRGKFLDPKTSEDEKAKIREYFAMLGKRGEENKPWAHVVGGGVDEVTGQQRPQYIVTGRGDQATTASTGADIAKRGQPQAIPPADKREVGKVYETPKGLLKWAGNGWSAA